MWEGKGGLCIEGTIGIWWEGDSDIKALRGCVEDERVCLGAPCQSPLGGLGYKKWWEGCGRIASQSTKGNAWGKGEMCKEGKSNICF